MGRNGTITVDLRRGGDYALADYARQSRLYYMARHPATLLTSFGAYAQAFGEAMTEANKRLCEFAKAIRAMDSPSVRALFDEEDK